jgi:hypothetical protein
MPRKAKLDPLSAAKKDKDTDAKHARRVLVGRVIQQQSLVQYRDRFGRMEVFRVTVQGEDRPWSADLFTRWLWQMRDVQRRSGLQGGTDALLDRRRKGRRLSETTGSCHQDDTKLRAPEQVGAKACG